MSSMLSPTMIKGRGDGEELGSRAGLATPHCFAMCKIPAGDGLGGLKSRVMIGVKAEMCEGRWVDSRWATGALFPEFVRRYLVGGD
jgi:hypothetical protein